MLTKLTISNVKNIVARVVELSGCTILLGHANKGKTSVLDSVRLLLGCVDRSDARGNAGVLPYMAIGTENMSVKGIFKNDATEGGIEFIRSYSGRQRMTHAFTTADTQTVEATQDVMNRVVGDCVFDTRTLTDFEAVAKVVAAECETDVKDVQRKAVMAVLEKVTGAPKGTWDSLPADLVSPAIVKLRQSNEELAVVPLDFLTMNEYVFTSPKVSDVCYQLSEWSKKAAQLSTEAYGTMRQMNAEIESIGKWQSEARATTRSLPELKLEYDSNHDALLTLRNQIKAEKEIIEKAKQQTIDLGDQQNKVTEAETAVVEAKKAVTAIERKMKKEQAVTAEGLQALKAVQSSDVLCAKCKKAIAGIITDATEDDNVRGELKSAQRKLLAAEKALATEQGKVVAHKETVKESRQPADVTELTRQEGAREAAEKTLKSDLDIATERGIRTTRLEQCRAVAGTQKKKRAVMTAVSEALDCVWAELVQSATLPFITACNQTLTKIKATTTSLEHMGEFQLAYTGGKMRFSVIRESGSVLYHTMGGTERVVVRNIVGCAVLSHRLAAGTAKEAILMDDIAEVSDEAVNPFLTAMSVMLKAYGVQGLYATCHLGGPDIESKDVTVVYM
jgi:MoxR-like ATPase